jgi:regulator of replication initiation timing
MPQLIVCRQLQDTSNSCTAAVITRPPEIVAVLKVPCSSGPDVFVVFDSHPRKDHPQGAGLIFTTSPESTAEYLFDLLKFDEQLLEDESLQWQAQLLANYSAHIFTATESIDAYAMSDAIIDASLSVLSLKAQVAQLTSDNTSANAEGKQLRDQLDQLEFENMELRDQIRRRNTASKGKQRYPDGHQSGSSGRSSAPKGKRFVLIKLNIADGWSKASPRPLSDLPLSDWVEHHPTSPPMWDVRTTSTHSSSNVNSRKKTGSCEHSPKICKPRHRPCSSAGSVSAKRQSTWSSASSRADTDFVETVSAAMSSRSLRSTASRLSVRHAPHPKMSLSLAVSSTAQCMLFR